MLTKALEIAAVNHRNQLDKAGEPYILHPLRVMFSLTTEPERICGLLHDVVEDTCVTLEGLRREGFSEEVLEVLQLVTKKNETEEYPAFIDRVLSSRMAAKVKLADLTDNMDPERLQKVPPEKRVKLLLKYEPAAKRIRDCLGQKTGSVNLNNQDPSLPDLIRKSLTVAVKAHEGQNRKGTKTPYIVHPVETALILREEGCGVEVMAGGLLHDVLEDGGVTEQDLVSSVGERVAGLVREASEKLEDRKNTPWEQRKQHTIQHLETAAAEVQMIACADKLSNVRSMKKDYLVMGDRLWDRFNRGYEDQKWYYTQLAESFGLVRHRKSYQEFVSLVEELFHR